MMLHNPLGFYLVVWIMESALLLHALVTEVQQSNFLNLFCRTSIRQGARFCMFANTILN